MIWSADALADARVAEQEGRDPDEDVHAASLWRRLVTAWRELPEADDMGESPLLDGISNLVDEWEAFVGDGSGARS